MGRARADTDKSSAAVAEALGGNIRAVALKRIREIRRSRLDPKDQRGAILELEGAIHREAVAALRWALDRCSFHAGAAMVPGSAFTDGGDP